jgi:hypothetical protein
LTSIADFSHIDGDPGVDALRHAHNRADHQSSARSRPVSGSLRYSLDCVDSGGSSIARLGRSRTVSLPHCCPRLGAALSPLYAVARGGVTRAGAGTARGTRSR